MRQHIIPVDGQPHAPTAECGCGPSAERVVTGDGTEVKVYVVHTPSDPNQPDDVPWRGRWMAATELEVDD